MGKSIFADLHTHTIGSLHAYSTVREIVSEAHYKGLDFVAITDHLFYYDEKILRKNEMQRIKYLNNVITKLPSTTRIIAGVELNLNQALERKDVVTIEQKVPWRLLGLHSYCLNKRETSVLEVPALFQRAIVDEHEVTPTAFAHIERNLYDMQDANFGTVTGVLSEIVDIAVKNDIYLEINNASLTKGDTTRELMKFWVDYAKQRNAKFCLGTDAHYCDDVGDFRLTKAFVEEMGLSDNDILNCHYSKLAEMANKAYE